MQKHKNAFRRWSKRDIEYLKSNYSRVSVSDIAGELKRSERATRSKLERLNCGLSTLERNKPKIKIARRKYKGWHFNSYGRKILSIKGKSVAEHRYLVEKKLGRRLLSEEQVHHINCDKTDNRVENLHLFRDAKSHLTSHRSLEKIVKELMGRGIIKFNSVSEKYEI